MTTEVAPRPETRNLTDSTPVVAYAWTPIQSVPSLVRNGAVAHDPRTSPPFEGPNRSGSVAVDPEEEGAAGAPVIGVAGFTFEFGFHVGGSGSGAGGVGGPELGGETGVGEGGVGEIGITIAVCGGAGTEGDTGVGVTLGGAGGAAAGDKIGVEVGIAVDG